MLKQFFEVPLIDTGGFSNAVEENAYIPLEPAKFNVVTLAVVEDLLSGYQYFRGSTLYELDSFTVEFNRDFFEYASKFSESESNSFEEFIECFGNSGGEIQKKLQEVLSFPQDEHRGVDEVVGFVLWEVQEDIEALCDYLVVPKKDFLKVFMKTDGLEVDRVFIDSSDLIAYYHRLKSGSIDEDDFKEFISESPMEFTVECHMFFKLCLEEKTLIDMLYKFDLCEHLVNKDDRDEPENKLEELVNRLIESLGHLKTTSEENENKRLDLLRQPTTGILVSEENKTSEIEEPPLSPIGENPGIVSESESPNFICEVDSSGTLTLESTYTLMLDLMPGDEFYVEIVEGKIILKPYDDAENFSLDKEDSDEDLAQKTGYFSLLRNNCSWFVHESVIPPELRLIIDANNDIIIPVFLVRRAHASPSDKYGIKLGRTRIVLEPIRN